jgi:phospholipase C
VTRRGRGALQAGAVVVLLGLLAAACTSAGGAEPTSGTPMPGVSASAFPPGDRYVVPGSVPGPLPAGVDASAFATRWPIKHVVFVIMENRSFDNIFGRFPGADGATTGRDHKRTRPLTRAELQTAKDLPHCFACNVRSIDHGKMDGFDQSAAADRYSYTSFHRDQITAYWNWAKAYSLSDHFFASATGPSFPNHMYTIAAQSGGARENPVQNPAAYHASRDAGLAKSWGCDIAKGGYVTISDSEGQLVHVNPCFNFETEGDLLRGKRIPWAYYASTNAQNGYIWSAYSAIGRYRNDPRLWSRYVRPVDDVIRDVHADRLPPITWITPQFPLSEHPDANFCYGQNWTIKLVDSIMASPMWKDTAIFLTWDDPGGFYDHVKPVRIDRFGLGIRVPMLTISPYAKRGYVDHSQGEFSSVLRFMEDNWSLIQLTKRDRIAGDMANSFDFSQSPRPPDLQPLRSDCRGPIWPKNPSAPAG